MSVEDDINYLILSYLLLDMFLLLILLVLILLYDEREEFRPLTLTSGTQDVFLTRWPEWSPQYWDHLFWFYWRTPSYKKTRFSKTWPKLGWYIPIYGPEHVKKLGIRR